MVTVSEWADAVEPEWSCAHKPIDWIYDHDHERIYPEGRAGYQYMTCKFEVDHRTITTITAYLNYALYRRVVSAKALAAYQRSFDD